MNFLVDDFLVYVCVHIPSSILPRWLLPDIPMIRVMLGPDCNLSHFQTVVIFILPDWCYHRIVEDVAKLLPTQSTRRTVKKRSILVYQGEVPRQAYIVISGSFKTYRLSNNGEEQIVGFRTKGDIFSESWLFGKTSSALYYYEALEDSEVLTVEKPVLLELIKDNKEIGRLMFEYLATGYTSMLMQITALEQSRAAEKLLMMMYYLMFRYGKQVKPNIYRVDLRLTHTTLGSLMGLTRETTTMELVRLKRKKIIAYDSKGYDIYRHELERRLNDESFTSLHLQND